MAVILDSDMLSILQRQEQMRGWLAALHKARTDERLLLAYRELQSMLRDFCHLNILPFDAAAQNDFKRLRRQKIRVGTMDLRIASITLATRSTLLSRNLHDFERVPGLVVEDWTS